MGVTKSNMFVTLPRLGPVPHGITPSFASTKITSPNGRVYVKGAQQLSASLPSLMRKSIDGRLYCSSSYTVSPDSCHYDNDDQDFVDGLSTWNCIGSSHGWLGYVDPRNLSFYLFKPSLINHPCYLPYILLPPIQFLSQDPNVISKMVLSSSPSAIYPRSFDNNNSSNKNSSVLVVITLDWLDQVGPVAAFCRVGDPDWTTLANFPLELKTRKSIHLGTTNSCSNNTFQDITYYTKHELFYVVTDTGTIYSWDLSNYHYCPMNQQQNYSNFRYLAKQPLNTFDPYYLKRVKEVKYYLVMDESWGSLMMIRLHISLHTCPGSWKEYLYDVDRLDFDSLEWFEVKALVDTALFIDRNNGIAIDVRKVPGLMKPDSIYLACNARNFFQVATHPVPCDPGLHDSKWDLLLADMMTGCHMITSFPVWNFES